MTLNRLLTDVDREYYKKLIEKMFDLCPETMAKKIDRANVQQAFMLDVIGKELELGNSSSILCVGSFEDTASECLGVFGVPVVNIDSSLNHDLNKFTEVVGGEYPDSYGIVFSTSVIEHVDDDDQFLKDMCSLLEPGGLGIITCDFKDDWRVGDPVIVPDLRFYTKKRLMGFKKTLKDCDCKLVDKPNWVGDPDFNLGGFDYSFATFVFRKNK